MTGKEAELILDELGDIYNMLSTTGPNRRSYEKKAYFQLGKLYQRLQMIIDVDMVSFNPTVENDNEM